MTKVKIHDETPTEKIISRVNAELASEIIDSQGRVIKLRVPDALDEMDFYSALGEQSTNMGVISVSMPLLYVKSINGEELPKVLSYSHIRAGVQRLGSEAIKKIQKAVMAYNKAQEESEQEQINAIKK